MSGFVPLPDLRKNEILLIWNGIIMREILLNKLNKTFFLCGLLVILCVASSTSVFARAANPPNKSTGAPNEGTCASAGCHTGNNLNAAGGSLMLSVPDNYTPGAEYDIVVELTRAGQSKWGFQMTALNNIGTRAGTFAISDANTQQVEEEDSKQYIEHKAASGTNRWAFKWTAPSSDVGPITFYAAGNAANNNFWLTGDYIYTQKATSDITPVYGVTLAGVGSLRKTVNTGVETKYTLRVTNTGNTRDTIRLTTSGIASARLSRTSVSLDADTSANVTLTIPGSALTSAGEYKTTVTATSQGDSSKTASRTTTTTILPVYGVRLAGVGSITRQTEDASTGVSYTLRVTNTGNTRDTFRLTTSGDVTATISPSLSSLNQGASRTVTLRISGTTLAKAGVYNVKLTATSQKDSSKTGEITTTTTILPVYNIALEGVGELTTETADASEGVSYTLKITNNGNTDDIVNITTSGDVAAILSSTEVPIVYGASANVILTISGDMLAKAGEYNLKVTTTSQGDNTKTAEILTTTTILPVYKIMLEGVGELTTETADASEGVSYTLKITNNGNTNDVIDLATEGTEATLSQTPVSLASGASAEVMLSISGDVLALANDYEVKVTATSQGDDTQTGEVTTTTTILPVYSVSLEGVGELTTETADASEGVSYTLKITNNGNTDDVIDLATEGTEATLSQTSVSLASGASAEVMLTISGNTLALAGTYEVKVTATSQGDDTQTDEVTTTTTILPVYDIALEGVSELTTETAEASEGVSYTLKITNNGNTNDAIDLATEGTEATLSQTSVSLASGASAEVMLTISGDVLALAGTYEVKVTATSQGDDTQTDEVTTTTTILPVYDIALEGIGELTTETSDASEGVSYTLKITNNGNMDDVIDLATEGTEAMLSQTSVSLASGASAEVMLTISGDVLALAGTYEVKVTATSQGDDTQTDEVTTTTTILPVYDIALEGVGELTTETADAREGVSYTLKITNNGNTDDVIDLATEGTEATLSQESVSLASGASAEVMLTISGNTLALAGTYEVKVTATSQGDDTQTDEVTTTTTVLPVYEVTLASDTLTGATIDAVEGVTYALTVTNIGNTGDTIVLSSSAEVGIGGAILGSFNLPDSEEPNMAQLEIMLDAGASTDVMFTASGDLLTQPGVYDIVVTATSQEDTTKTAEITTTTTITAIPPEYGVMLEGVGELVGATMDILTGVTYTLKVTNTGNTEDTIVLGSSAEAGIEGSVLGSFGFPDDNETPTSQLTITLESGASMEVMFTAAGDFFTKPGEYEIVVTATSQGDNTKTAEVTTTTTVLPVYGVALVSDTLTGETTEAVEGVTYTLTVTNTGNTNDTVVLSSSAEVGIGGAVLGSFNLPDSEEPNMAQLEIMLDAGASTDVLFTAAGDLLTQPGEYKIVVTATSQGDTTKTAEITTTTTITAIPPEYGVQLQGVGELKGTTWDFLKGVTYTLTVTNTGNTEDTIMLGSSAEVGIGGAVLGSFSLPDSEEPATSQLQITLDAEESVEVNFTASGDLLTQPGEYEIVVTATSQGDTTKTTEVSTRTTIEPVPWDLNADGKINILDLVAVSNQFGESGEGLSGDVNMDGDVNILDLVAVANQFGKTSAEIVQAANQ